MAGTFGEFFLVSVSPRNKARKLLKKFGENSEQNSGQNSGQNFKKFGENSFCTSFDLKNGSQTHSQAANSTLHLLMDVTWPQLGPFLVPAYPPLTVINGY